MDGHVEATLRLQVWEPPEPPAPPCTCPRGWEETWSDLQAHFLLWGHCWWGLSGVVLTEPAALLELCAEEQRGTWDG